MENKVSSIQNEYELLKSNESELKSKLSHLSKSYDMLKIECKNITSSNEKLNEWKSCNELTLSENKKSIESLNDELAQKIEEIKTIQDEFTEYKQNQEATLEAKIEEINNLNNKVLDLEKDIKVHKIEVTALTEEIEIWKENEKTLKETYGDLHYSLLVAQEENKNYKNKLEENEEKIKNYEGKVKELQSHLYALVENPETEVNTSVLMTDEKIAANNIKISILEEINDNYRKIQLDKVNTKSVKLKDKIEKARKSQELFENEKLKKLLQKSKAYEEQMNNYINNYTPLQPERKRDIRSASSIVTIESVDDESSYNRSDEIKNNKVLSKNSSKNYPNNINSLDYDDLISYENTSNNNHIITPHTNNYFIKPSNSSSSNNTSNNTNTTNNTNNRFPTLNKENESKNTNNKVFWNAPKKNTKLNNIYPTTYTSSIKMAEIIYKGFPKPNKYGNSNSNTNNKINNKSKNGNTVAETNKTPMIQNTTTSLTSSKNAQLQNSMSMKTLYKIPTKYPPAELSKYMIPSTITKEPTNKSSHIAVYKFNGESIESSVKINDSKVSKPSTTKHLTFSNTTNYNYSKRK
ncbi:hypothetical protein PIROE2DRAFT_14297 [Piromyces sp. E2]|nr:hypothetical protein PIROE2DRAFT_14297 [Piromyces sp. E2]|eukprot:OUM60041.1 hypothetical protein PIROE2DRAFT_14297 [Piromyces sp. E2]